METCAHFLPIIVLKLSIFDTNNRHNHRWSILKRHEKIRQKTKDSKKKAKKHGICTHVKRNKNKQK